MKIFKDNGDANKRYKRILIYPTTEEKFYLKYRISGHRFSIRTINLNQDWRNIHNELMEIIAV